MQAQPILIKLQDDSAGYEVAPDRVPMASLREFVSDVSDLLRGDSASPELSSIEVAVVQGSLGIQTQPLADAALWADLRSLAQSERLDALSPKRRKVIERWQGQAHKARRVTYEISSAGLPSPVVVSAHSDFHADDADQWVRVERYFRGEIEDLGGVKPNAHIRLPDGKRLTVAADRSVLREDKSNRLYKPGMVRISAEYNVQTGAYRKEQLIEFVDHGPRFDEREFARLTERGAKAWQDVEDASAWVDALRGNDV